ncbi:transglycosylase domain-containing protein [Caldovatus aquaticus]|uniref:peptidoglycan glycosyltransferase n=1 Tax=Caldovatus aquaticus TaxID=2865671 RepID=A0ABS7F3W2_9PROT|nr:PBP1A family penicillin-binding protein [Caldovatus aquaticus]MBW8269511.1 PBP1A family penicillin-binding protein [Caldovatus aquaticus]
MRPNLSRAARAAGPSRVRPAPGGRRRDSARAGASSPAGGSGSAGRRRPLPLRLLRWGILLAVWGGVALGGALLWFAHDLPQPEVALAATRQPSVTLLAADGRLLATAGDLYGEPLRLAEMPPYLPAALIAVEDRRFRAHFGLDPVGLARAAWVNLSAGRVAQGGSTLTQQLAKNLFLTPERSLRRKVQEALLALWLERRFTKDELLEIYLNRVYLGAGAYGVDAAARLYFGVSARRVTLGQAALLAGLPRAPSRLNPRAAPEAAIRRAMEVLEAMAEQGLITRAQAAAEGERLRLAPAPSRDAGWFADWVQGFGGGSEGRLAARFPGAGDLVLRTTLDSRLQAAVESRLEALLAGPGARLRVSEGAVVALDAATGAVRAMAGGRDYRASPFNRATQARRQPGSAFKPIVFLAALEQGMRPEDPVADTPLRLGGWSPGNGEWRARGEITAEEALAHSVNTAAVRVLQRAGGPRRVAELAARLGLDASRFPHDASLALGTGEVTLLDLAAAYAAIANGGWRVVPHGLLAARGEGGRALPVPPAGGGAGGAAPARRVVAAEHAEALGRMLAAVVRQGTGRAAALPGWTVAGKTGTSQEYRDAWFLGFAERPGGGAPLVLGIWLGNDDASPMREVSGGTLAARLFRDILEAYGRPDGAAAMPAPERPARRG